LKSGKKQARYSRMIENDKRRRRRQERRRIDGAIGNNLHN
jgi:hypothetical protein